MNKKSSYKVWVHIERVTEDGDVLEGDEYHEPHEAGEFDTLEAAEAHRDAMIDGESGWTVILAYPDGELFTEWSDEAEELAAVADVRQKAVAADGNEDMDPDDFGLIGVIGGHHELNALES
jgi:hypothetical protein